MHVVESKWTTSASNGKYPACTMELNRIAKCDRCNVVVICEPTVLLHRRRIRMAKLRFGYVEDKTWSKSMASISTAVTLLLVQQ